MLKKVQWPDQVNPARPLVCIKSIEPMNRIVHDIKNTEFQEYISNENRQQRLRVLIDKLAKYFGSPSLHVAIDMGEVQPLNSPV